MASDEDYAAFLERANEAPGSGGVKTTAAGKGKVQLKAVDEGAKVPQVLQKAIEEGEWVYVSDADEPFEPVSLKTNGSTLPDEKTFATLIHHPNPKDVAGDIEILDVVKWDPRGQYKALVDATREACQGADVRVYRVPIGGTRVEYWVVGLDGKGGRLVGVKALGVES